MNSLALQDILKRPGAIAVPGICDALSLKLAQISGFQAAFLSGAGLSMSRYGRPDLGFVGLNELTETVAAMTEATDVPLIVDIDTGFGNALNVSRTVKLLERAGAAALQMEDQTAPKRCGHLSGKSVIAKSEMAGKIRAAVDARSSDETLIFARTDALGVHGIDDALDRGEAYLEAGADALFIEAPKNIAQMKRISQRFGSRIPLIHNLVEGGKSPVQSKSDVEVIGYKIALFPLAFMHAAIPAGRAILNHLFDTGQTKSWPGAHDDLSDLNRYVELQRWLDMSEEFI